MTKQYTTSTGSRDWTKEEMIAYLDWSRAEDSRIKAQVAQERERQPFDTGRRGVEAPAHRFWRESYHIYENRSLIPRIFTLCGAALASNQIKSNQASDLIYLTIWDSYLIWWHSRFIWFDGFENPCPGRGYYLVHDSYRISGTTFRVGVPLEKLPDFTSAGTM